MEKEDGALETSTNGGGDSQEQSTDQKEKDNKESLSHQETAYSKECNVYVCHLPTSITKEQVHVMFSSYGELKDVRLLLDSRTQEPKGVAFVHFAKMDDAKTAIESVNGLLLAGNEKPLECRLAKPNSKSTSQYGREADWQCASCSFVNFAGRVQCRDCGMHRESRGKGSRRGYEGRGYAPRQYDRGYDYPPRRGEGYDRRAYDRHYDAYYDRDPYRGRDGYEDRRGYEDRLPYEPRDGYYDEDRRAPFDWPYGGYDERRPAAPRRYPPLQDYDPYAPDVPPAAQGGGLGLPGQRVPYPATPEVSHLPAPSPAPY